MSRELQEIWGERFLNNYSAPAITLVSGRGAVVKDTAGKRYLDFIGGIAVNSIGHSHKRHISAIKKQAKKLVHTSNLYANEPTIQLARKLGSLSRRRSKVFFCNSGAEANEAAFKITRLAKKGVTVSLENSFHGRTMGALTLTGQKGKQVGFDPLVGNVRHIPLNDTKTLTQFADPLTAAFYEPIQGEGGVVDLDVDYLKKLESILHSQDAFTVADEVQTGIGRCGYWYLSEALELEPDVIVLAKGLAGGLPIGAIVVFERLFDVFTPGSHGSTFGGNPLATAAALSVISIIEEENLLENSRIRGEQIVINLNRSNFVHSISGAGLLRGLKLNEPIAKKLVSKSRELGLLINATSDDVIRLAPPLIVSKKQVDRACEILEQAVRQI